MGFFDFFKKKPNNITNESSAISDKLKQKFLNELQRDPEKEFGPEYKRTTNLEYSLVTQYGIEGLKLVLAKKNTGDIFPLGEFPADCPWSNLNSKTLTQAIDAVFNPIKNKIPDLIAKMQERIRFIYATKTESIWKLNYFLDIKLYDDQRDYFLIYSGGAPDSNPSLNSQLEKYNWSLPAPLQEFYSIHNGFGSLDNSKVILNSEKITVMGEMMNPITKEQNVKPEGYEFNNLLEFYPDEVGNAQCFIRENGNNTLTVDWDHETWEISEESDFFDFIDESLSQLDEE